MYNINIDLIVACRLNKTKECEQLIHKGADVNYVVKEEDFSAIKDTLRYVYNMKSSFDEQNNYDIHSGFTPLMALACSRGNDPDDLSVFNLLIDKGANINYQSCGDSCTTPLMIAASKGYTTLVSALIESGADVNVINSYGSTAFSSFGALYDTDNEDHFFDKLACLEILIDHVKDVNHTDHQGWSALSAIIRNATDYDFSSSDIEFLIIKGADPSIKNYKGQSIIDFLEENIDEVRNTDLLGYLKDYHQSFSENQLLTDKINNFQSENASIKF